MLIQRKLLTTEQKNNICKKYWSGAGHSCTDCPLKASLLGNYFCIYNLDQVQYAIEKYLNEEIEVE